MVQESLTGALMSGARHSHRVPAEMKENPGEPLPITVMHGEEQGGLATLRPCDRSILKWSEIQLTPPARKEKKTFSEGIAEQTTW
jgi:hypothetical protein